MSTIPKPPPSNHIALSAGGAFRGPTPVAAPIPIRQGETLVTLTTIQLTDYRTLAAANPASPLLFNGTTFVLTPYETVRVGLLAILAKQTDPEVIGIAMLWKGAIIDCFTAKLPLPIILAALQHCDNRGVAGAITMQSEMTALVSRVSVDMIQLGDERTP